MSQTVETIQRRMRNMLADCITVRDENGHLEEWRSGVKGAILEGRITILQELLVWMEA